MKKLDPQLHRLITTVAVSRHDLLQLEKSQHYLFHGSPIKLNRLEPRQPFDLDTRTNRMAEDGGPVVCASPCADVAVFRAIANTSLKVNSYHTAFDVVDNILILEATANVIEAAKTATGWFHIVERTTFAPHNSIEWRCRYPVHPLCVLSVSYEHLISKVSVVDDDSISWHK